MQEIKKAWEQAKDRLKLPNPQRPDLHTPKQTKVMLTSLSTALQGNKRFQAISPNLHKGGMIYSLNDKGEGVEAKDTTWVGHLEGFNINHNAAPATLALGAGGGGDCHSTQAHMFKGQIVTDMWGPTGKPTTINSGRLFGCKPRAFYVNQSHLLACAAPGGNLWFRLQDATKGVCPEPLWLSWRPAWPFISSPIGRLFSDHFLVRTPPSARQSSTYLGRRGGEIPPRYSTTPSVVPWLKQNSAKS